ncbi:hypothetical protein BGZ99_008304 [Dissophora globulifera]|uniref:MYND-type domain-containing protein n=1 Tax=Dissophora globulifera TaxID=979702 RepID=A0A9P6R8H7_9FUNG|nr:hypothetical protein BGZ99_008304 [Dissophora globulifera]
MSTCGNCGKSSADIGEALKRCAKCKSVQYCSHDCQKAHWKVHKKTCTSATQGTAASTTTTPSSKPEDKPLSFRVKKPFTKLDKKTWLHGRPEQDVFRLLIDCYRLRMEDEYSFEGNVAIDSLYGGAASGVDGFKKFLRLTETRKELLPQWWSTAKAQECVKFGSGPKPGERGLLDYAVEKPDLIEEYGDSSMPMQLRMLGEQIYEKGIGGKSCAGMLKMQLLMEDAGPGSQITTLNPRLYP